MIFYPSTRGPTRNDYIESLYITILWLLYALRMGWLLIYLSHILCPRSAVVHFVYIETANQREQQISWQRSNCVLLLLVVVVVLLLFKMFNASADSITSFHHHLPSCTFSLNWVKNNRSRRRRRRRRRRRKEEMYDCILARPVCISIYRTVTCPNCQWSGEIRHYAW